MKCSIRILRKFKYEVDSRPANLKGILTFDHAPASYFRGCPLTLTLTKDEDRSAEYIGAPHPCRLIEHIKSVGTHTLGSARSAEGTADCSGHGEPRGEQTVVNP